MDEVGNACIVIKQVAQSGEASDPPERSRPPATRARPKGIDPRDASIDPPHAQPLGQSRRVGQFAGRRTAGQKQDVERISHRLCLPEDAAD
jgi:hypothetical protein